MPSFKQLSTLANLPEGAVPLNSPVYIERPPIEAKASETIKQPGSLLRIRAPRKMGQSSLLLRIEDHAKTLGYQVVSLDLRQVDRPILSHLDSLLR